ncbi:MAG TPA: hypothetical protein VFX97_20725 [Pyrinomonadaceae bacterium]|nr:hypothetical protein [Pyrinomonadaceae bacterium]
MADQVLGDMAVTELLRKAQEDLAGLRLSMGSDATLVQRAYLASLGAKLCVAEDKLTEYLVTDRS